VNTRDELLDAAELVARRLGYDGFSYADLAAAVGIRKASIHYHFPHKSDLAVALLSRYRGRFAAALAEIEASGESARSQLLAYVEIYRQALRGGESVCLCVSLGLAGERLDEVAAAEVRRFHGVGVDWLTRLHGRGQVDGSLVTRLDAETWAEAVVAAMEGAHVSTRVARGTAGLEVFDRVARAVLAQTEAA
jgi:TetR/AcrR family transcriptional regulator, transcriptional repressor for nem operon